MFEHVFDPEGSKPATMFRNELEEGETGDARSRPRWELSLLGHPGAKFSVKT